MGKQINQYTKTRTKIETQSDDLIDLDSTEDSGVTFESAKIKVSEFVAYIVAQLPPITMYVIDGTILANRTLTALTRWTKWKGGDVIVEMADAINDYGFAINDNASTEKARMGYDQATNSGIIEVKDSVGTFLEVNDGKVSVGTGPSTANALVLIKGKELYNGAAEILLEVDNGRGHPNLDTKLRIDSAGNFLSDGITTFGTISGSFVARHGSFRLTQFQNIGTSVYEQGYTAFFSKSYGNTSNRTNSNGIGCDDLNPAWNSFAKLNIAGNEIASGHTSLNVFNNVNYTFSSSNSNTTTLVKISKTVGTLGNTGTGESYLVGLDIDLQERGSVNYAALFNGGTVGIGTTAPHSSAVLDIASENKGFATPRMTTIQRDAISSPMEGLEIYNLITHKKNFYNGTIWEVITSA